MHSSFAIAAFLSAVSAVHAANTVVQVGAGGALAYTPTNIDNAAVGDTVTFTFEEKNHTATQSTFANPCTPMSGGFNSGFQPITNSTPPTAVYTVTNASAPVWFFCEQTNPLIHCQAGMVFAINAPTTGKTFAAFQAAAKASGSTNASASSSSLPSGTSGTSSASTAAASAGSTVSASSAAASSSSTTTSSAMKLSGSAAGVLTAVAFLVGLVL